MVLALVSGGTMRNSLALWGLGMLAGTLPGCHFHFYGCNHKECHEAGETLPVKVETHTIGTPSAKPAANRLPAGTEEK